MEERLLNRYVIQDLTPTRTNFPLRHPESKSTFTYGAAAVSNTSNSLGTPLLPVDVPTFCVSYLVCSDRSSGGSCGHNIIATSEKSFLVPTDTYNTASLSKSIFEQIE